MAGGNADVGNLLSYCHPRCDEQLKFPMSYISCSDTNSNTIDVVVGWGISGQLFG